MKTTARVLAITAGVGLLAWTTMDQRVPDLPTHNHQVYEDRLREIQAVQQMINEGLSLQLDQLRADLAAQRPSVIVRQDWPYGADRHEQRIGQLEYARYGR